MKNKLFYDDYYPNKKPKKPKKAFLVSTYWVALPDRRSGKELASQATSNDAPCGTTDRVFRRVSESNKIYNYDPILPININEIKKEVENDVYCKLCGCMMVFFLLIACICLVIYIK